MTAQTICLLVTGNTALQILPGRWGMAEDPEGLIVVICAPDPTCGIQAEAGMACPTEGFRIMAGAAIAHSAVRLGTMGGQEVHRVEGRGALACPAGVVV